MATSGSYGTNAIISSRNLTFSWWQNGQDISGNYTDIGWQLVGSGGTTTSYVKGQKFRQWVDGNFYESTANRSVFNGTVIMSGTTRIWHDTVGNKSFGANTVAQMHQYTDNTTGSGSWALNQIPRYANITNFWITDVTQSSFKFNVSADRAIDHVQYSLNGGGWTDGGNQVITGRAPNTQYNIRCRVKSTASQLWTESGYLYPTTTDVARLTGANDFSDEGNGYMTYNNVAGNGTSQLVAGLYWNGSEALMGYRDVNKTGTLNYTFVPSAAERQAIRDRMKNTPSMTITYYLRTTVNGAYYYSTINKTITIINAKPTLNDFSYQDTNATTKALTGNDQIIVKGKSNLRVYGITATTLKSATKKTVIVDGVGAPWTDTYEKTINRYSKNTIAVSMTDSRDDPASGKTKTITFKEYFDVTKGDFSATRGSNGVGEGITLVCKGTFFNANFGAVTNNLAATYRYKNRDSSTWITGTTAISFTKSGNNYTISQAIKGDVAAGFNIENSYDIEVTVKDKLSTAVFNLVLIAGTPAIAVIGNKIAFGGQFDESTMNKEIQFKKDPYLKSGNMIIDYKITKRW